MTLVTLKAAPAANGWVEVWLLGSGGKTAGGLDLTGKKVLLDRVARVQLDATGSATVELLPTASLTPAGTVYRANFSAGGVSESLTFGGFTGTGPVDATDFVVDPPGALASPALTTHAAAVDPHPSYVLESTLAVANGVATLGADAKIPGAQLPSLAIGETFTVASQAAMLALVAQRGDVAVRTDLDPDGFFLLTADAPSVLANWVQITAPGAVTSVDGQVGAVGLSGTYVPLVGGTSTGEQVAPSFKASGKTGATATPITLAGGTASGAPTTGAHIKGEVVLDDTGAAWYCTTPGTPGTWTRIGGEPVAGFMGAPLPSTRYVAPPSMDNTGSASAALAAGQLIFSPLFFYKAVTLDRIGLEVMTAVAATTIRLGLYGSTADMPGPLIIDAGTIDSSTTGYKEITINQAIPAGVYYAVAVPVGGAPVWRAQRTLFPEGSNASGSLTFYNFGSWISTASTHTGALPNPSPALSAGNGATLRCPRVLLRVA